VAEKAAVIACENRIADYGSVGIKIDQPTGVATVVGNVFQSKEDRAGVVVTGGQAIIEGNRITGPQATEISTDGETQPGPR
jgi:hypothetical protein